MISAKCAPLEETNGCIKFFVVLVLYRQSNKSTVASYRTVATWIQTATRMQSDDSLDRRSNTHIFKTGQLAGRAGGESLGLGENKDRKGV